MNPRSLHPFALILVLLLVTQVATASAADTQILLSALPDNGLVPFESDGRTRRPEAVDWSKAVVESTLKRYPNPKDFGGWRYARALYLFGQYLVFKRTGDRRYLDYIRGWIDSHVDDSGRIDRRIDALDYMLPGNLLLVLYEETKQPKYKLAADEIRQRFNSYPRTSDGGLWHATSRQNQLWLDGMFMAMPFLVRYGRMFGESASAIDEAASQILIYASHLRDPRTGLLYHAYDESGTQRWADPTTHHSAEFWCRAIGWYGMALVDILELLPRDHPKRTQLLVILRDLIKALAKFQDTKTGLWFQVVDKGATPGNWLETSSSSMFSYVVSIAVKRRCVRRQYAKVATKGCRGVLAKLAAGEDELTSLSDISEGTNVGDLAYYLARKRNVNDFHGLGAFLLMNEQAITAKSSMELEGRSGK